jgi:hypothetical protein
MSLQIPIPPAFPVAYTEEMEFYKGMTLRDYFAALVLQGMCAANGIDTWREAAVKAYVAADAMLKAREL